MQIKTDELRDEWYNMYGSQGILIVIKGGNSMKLYFEGSQIIVQDNNKEVQLEYYLVEEENVLCETSPYGIRVVQKVGDEVMEEYSDAISYDREKVAIIIEKLIKNSVPVSTFLEIVDDLVTEYISK